MAGDSPLRVAVVGLGWAARNIWLPCLTGNPRFAVVVAVEPAPEARAQAVVPPGCALLDRSDELSAAAVDLAVVAVPNHVHAAVAAPLLGRGIPVFLEKPVCLSAAEVSLLRDAEQRGAILLAGSAARHRSDVAALARLLPSLGPVRHMELSWIRARGIPQGDGWFTDQRLSGGGALVDLGWHLLDVGFALLGTQPESFSGVGVRHAVGSLSADFLTAGTAQAAWRADRGSGRTGDVEDGARVMLVTDDGVSILLRTSWASHLAYDLTQIKVEGPAGTARLDCTFGFSPNRVSRSMLTVLRDGAREEVALTDDQIGQEYHRQVAALRDALAYPDVRGRAVADAARMVQVIEQVYATATPLARRADPLAEPAPVSTAVPDSLPVVGHGGEVQALESAAAAAAAGERFLLHAELPAGAARFDRAWSSMVISVRLVLLNAVGLAYGTGIPIVTLLQPLSSAEVSSTDGHYRMLRLAHLLRTHEPDTDEIARTQGRLARLRSGNDSTAPFVLRELKTALAFVQANGGRTAAIEQVLRAATYLAGQPPSASPDWLQRDRLTGRPYAVFAHAVVAGDRPSTPFTEAANPVILRWRPGSNVDLFRRRCAQVDPSRSAGRLLIILEPDSPPDLSTMVAALDQEGHRPAWVCRYQALADGPTRLHTMVDALTQAGAVVGGVSIPTMNRQMEHLAAIAQVFADRTAKREERAPASTAVASQHSTAKREERAPASTGEYGERARKESLT
jgi:oxidoreductase